MSTFETAKEKAALNDAYDKKLEELERGVKQKRITLSFALARAMTYGIQFVSDVSAINDGRGDEVESIR